MTSTRTIGLAIDLQHEVHHAVDLQRTSGAWTCPVCLEAVHRDLRRLMLLPAVLADWATDERYLLTTVDRGQTVLVFTLEPDGPNDLDSVAAHHPDDLDRITALEWPEYEDAIDQVARARVLRAHPELVA